MDKMESKTNVNGSNGSGDVTLDRLVVIMACILFFGTAQVMSTHAPKIISDVIGFDASYIFGVISAICVEWGALRLHFNAFARHNNTAVYVKWILLSISGLCQIYNAALQTGTMSELSETLKIGFVWVVPNIPLLFIVLMFWIGTLSDIKQVSIVERVAKQGGLKHILAPKWNEFWNGKGYVATPTVNYATDEKQEELDTKERRVKHE